MRLLAACAPADIFDDTRAHADIYRELQLHLQSADADRSTEQPVRRWLVNQIRFLWQTDTVGAWATAAELGERLINYWSAEVPAPEDDPLLLRLQTQLANVYRPRGEFRRAYDLDAQTLARQRRVLGLRHLRTLMTARSYAADLRQLGDGLTGQAASQHPRPDPLAVRPSHISDFRGRVSASGRLRREIYGVTLHQAESLPRDQVTAGYRAERGLAMAKSWPRDA